MNRAALAILILLVGVHVPSRSAATSIFLPGGGYVPQPSDTYVPADAGACCFGTYYSLTNNYLVQTFSATGAEPISLTLGLANNLPNDVPPEPFVFQLLFTTVSGVDRPGSILWSSPVESLPAVASGYADFTVPVSGVSLNVGSEYAWVLDAYSYANGTQYAGAYLADIGSTVPRYTAGALYELTATGQDRTADFATGPITAPGSSAAFLIQYSPPVPLPAAAWLLLSGLGGLGLFARKRTA